MCFVNEMKLYFCKRYKFFQLFKISQPQKLNQISCAHERHLDKPDPIQDVIHSWKRPNYSTQAGMFTAVEWPMANLTRT